MIRCWCGYLFGVRCRLFAHGSADATGCPVKEVVKPV